MLKAIWSAFIKTTRNQRILLPNGFHRFVIVRKKIFTFKKILLVEFTSIWQKVKNWN